MDKYKRQTAYKTSIQQITESEYFQGQQDKPNHVLIGNSEVTRVNVIGVAVNMIPTGFKTTLIDDGTGRIQLRFFDTTIPSPEISVGDALQVIGKIREQEKEKYLVPEIVKKIDNSDWIKLRQKEINLKTPQVQAGGSNPSEPRTTKDSEETSAPATEKTEPPIEQVIALIKKKDDGSGADTIQIIKESTQPNTEQIIQTLLKNGEVFEIKPGKIKILE